MKRFLVTITRDITESCQIEVKAETAEQANALALDALRRRDLDIYDPCWEVDDGVPSDSECYLPDPDSTEEIGDYLNRNGIAVRSGHHCAQPILRRFGLESTVRASLALYNTIEDIDALVTALWNLWLGRTAIE